MAGETFDLGRVIQTAEAIKGMRRESALDSLRQQYMGMQMQGQQQAQDIARQDATMKWNAEEAKRSYAAAQQVLALPEGQRKRFVEQNFPQFIPELQKNGVDWASVDEPTLAEMARGVSAQAAAAAGILPEKQEGFTLSPGQSRFGADGKPIASVADAPSAPSSWQEFTLSQKDPEFRRFLESRKGKGISITQPDGSVIQIGGDGGGVSAGDLSSPTKTKLQDAIIQSTDELERLNSIGEGFDPQFLQIPGRLKGASLKVKDLAGMELNADEKDYLTKFSTFKADAAKNLSTILNRLSGAAISPAEGERLKKGIPNDDDSPTQFVAKYRAAVKDSTRAIMRANWALKNGIGVNSVEQLSRSMPLSGIDHVFEDRANDIWQEMGGTPETKAQAIQRANREFGIAR